MRPLLNRSEELDAIDGALRGARSGRGSVTLIEGAAGIGKSRLIDAAELNASTLGVRSGRASGWRPSRDPLGAMISLLGPLVAEGGIELFGGAAERARTLFDGELPGEGPEDAFAVVDALYWLVSNLAEREPLVLLIDDLQWTDEVTVGLIKRLGDEIEDLPLAILVGLRTGEPLSEGFGEAMREIEELHELQPEPPCCRMRSRRWSVTAWEPIRQRSSAKPARRPAAAIRCCCASCCGRAGSRAFAPTARRRRSRPSTW